MYFFKIGKFISVDGDPFLRDEKNSINIWFTGTSLRITKKYKDFKNNYVNMDNPIIDREKKLFKFMPIIHNRKQIRKDRKIIFMGKYFSNQKNELLSQEELISCEKTIY